MNVVLIISDTFRFDNLTHAGPMPVRTPCLDAFAQRAVSCTNVLTGSFPTIPHRTDLTSGRFGWPWYPWQARELGTQNHFPQILAQAGYVSQLICDCPHLFPARFNSGFHAAVALRGQESDLAMLRMNHPIEHVMPPEKTRMDRFFQKRNLPDLSAWHNRDWQGEEDRFPPRTAAMAVRFLEENYRHHPFFLWVDFFDPHEPWDAPEYMVRRYDPDYRGTPMVHPNYGKASDLTPKELRNLRAHYCAEAELVDRWVGRVLQKIEDLGLFENSVVLFTSDHGMSLGEHNRTGKSNINDGDDRYWPIYPEIAHVPLLIAAPGLTGGRTVGALLQPPDILPTVLDLAGAQARPPQPFHGQSRAALLRGEAGARGRDVAVAASYVRAQNGKVRPKECTPVVYTAEWAYAPIGAEGRPELYDRRTDPLAARDVAAQWPDVCRQLHAHLLRWLADHDAPAEAVAPYRSE